MRYPHLEPCAFDGRDLPKGKVVSGRRYGDVVPAGDTPKFAVGAIYARQEIHDRFGGSRQSGICPSRRAPVVLLFTGPTGEQHGYGFDQWRDAQHFLYTGEGQQGDMIFVRGNRAIRDHDREGRSLHLFEQVTDHPNVRGAVRYLGEFRYAGHSIEPRDSSGSSREVIIFDLERVPPSN